MYHDSNYSLKWLEMEFLWIQKVIDLAMIFVESGKGGEWDDRSEFRCAPRFQVRVDPWFVRFFVIRSGAALPMRSASARGVLSRVSGAWQADEFRIFASEPDDQLQ